MNIATKIIRYLKQYSIHEILTGVKIILALLLISCLFNVSRDHYRIVRYLVFLTAIWIAYVEINKVGYIAGIASALTAIMINPIIPFYIPQHQWLFFYAALAIALIAWSVYEIYLIENTRKKNLRYRSREH